MEHQEGAQFLGPAGGYIATGGGGYPGFFNTLSSGDTIGPVVQLGVTVNFIGYYKDSGGDSYRIPKSDTGNRVWRSTYSTWLKPAAGEVLRAEGMQTAAS